MNLVFNGISVTVPETEVAKIVTQRLTGLFDHPASNAALSVPRIGEYWPGQGGIYMGVMRGEEGAPDYHLIVAKEFDEELTWKEAMARASEVEADGHKDFTLPTRYELSLCFANRCELFRKEWHWSSTQHADFSSHAWMQNFSYGGQGNWYKDGVSRARAVRRRP